MEAGRLREEGERAGTQGAITMDPTRSEGSVYEEDSECAPPSVVVAHASPAGLHVQLRRAVRPVQLHWAHISEVAVPADHQVGTDAAPIVSGPIGAPATNQHTQHTEDSGKSNSRQISRVDPTISGPPSRSARSAVRV